MKRTTHTIPAKQRDELLAVLRTRFEKNTSLHKGLNWTDVEPRLMSSPDKLWSLQQMEATGGEPDVIGQDKKTGEYLFCDCSLESPVGRRSVCYDRAGWESRKDARPDNTAMDMAEEMGVALLTEEEYHELQKLGKFDQKTSSWLFTPEPVRKLGGAIFGDYRFGRVFIYHNGAQSYYAARGFRGMVRV
jgi:hypothetical protein